MHPPVSSTQLSASHTNGPHDADVASVRMQLAHAPASRLAVCHASHVAWVAVVATHAATNPEMSDALHAPVNDVGRDMVSMVRLLVSQSSQASVHCVGVGMPHGPRFRIGVGDSPPHTVTVAPSHAHAAAPLHCPWSIGGGRHVPGDEHPTFGENRHCVPFGQSTLVVQLTSVASWPASVVVMSSPAMRPPQLATTTEKRSPSATHLIRKS